MGPITAAATNPETPAARWIDVAAGEVEGSLLGADDVAVPGATASTLTLAPSTLDTRISVAVTATADGYAPKSASSSATGSWAASFTERPRIAGARRLGQVLTAEPGSAILSGTTATYQWLRRGQPIAGATAQTYVAKAADVRSRLSVRVTLTAPHWAPAVGRAGTRTPIKSVPEIRVRTSGHATWARVSIRVVTPGAL